MSKKKVKRSAAPKKGASDFVEEGKKIIALAVVDSRYLRSKVPWFAAGCGSVDKSDEWLYPLFKAKQKKYLPQIVIQYAMFRYYKAPTYGLAAERVERLGNLLMGELEKTIFLLESKAHLSSARKNFLDYMLRALEETDITHVEQAHLYLKDMYKKK